MITIRKLATLKRETRLRKIAAILQSYEFDLRAGRPLNLDYLAGLGALLLADEELPLRLKGRFRTLTPGYSPTELLRLCNSARHDLLVHLGAEPADWDFLIPETGHLDAGTRTIFPMSLYLDDLRSPFNVGSIVRCAESFGVARLLLSEATPLPTHPKAKRVSMGCWEIVPWEVSSPEALQGEENLFAMETGGTPIEEFAF
ncbi:MAG TPA: TrmH family RNA methyltransferase, partial [Spirochaetia bacterium]|nr:TrmH family RNA methyltransferase [Spirochaetia bacterium]